METTQSTTETTQPSTSKQSASPRKPLSKRMLLIIGGIVVVLIAVIAGIFASASNKPIDKTGLNGTSQNQPAGLDQLKKAAQSSPNSKATSHLLVYGTWTGQESLIKAVDLTNSNNLMLATLPLEIKKVNVLNDISLLYIDQTDVRDHGKQISLYNIKTKAVSANIPASDGFLIDDYALSPDKKYLAIWEVSFAQGSEVLQGGRSRVYAVDIAHPTVKKLIYDETVNTTTPVHYPRAILNDGTVFADTFMANDPSGGAGWSYGMSVANFEGSTKKDIESMKAGTYSTQPTLSADGKYLLFSGYDGSKGDGNAIKNGFRQALLSPNTVELLDTKTLERFRFPNLDNGNAYSAATWDKVTGNVMITLLSKDINKTGLYSYDLAERVMRKVNLPSSGETYSYVSQLPGNKTLISTSDYTEDKLGNLGNGYNNPITQLALLNGNNNISPLAIQDPYMQYITILPGTYFNSVLGAKTIAQAIIVKPTIIDLYSDKNDKRKSLQLYTFFLKTELAATRLQQQTRPTSPGGASATPGGGGIPLCRELAVQICMQQGNAANSPGLTACTTNYEKTQQDDAAKAAGHCHDSPLYLYGDAGKKVDVQIHTPVFNAIPAYNNGYAVTLGQGGEMVIDGKSYQGLTYNYTSNLRRLSAPKGGIVVKKTDVEKALQNYADKLGLNSKETADLVTTGKQKTTSPYVFISFFDQTMSQHILPITFNPQPDNYLNVVFYFKLLADKPLFTPIAPTFPDPITRSGFTAVEVSEIVE